MPYPGQFHRLVLIGSLYSDQFNTTLNIVPSALGELGMPEVSPANLTAVAARVATWFASSATGPGIGIIGACKLESIKLNRIGADGHYVDPETREHVYPTPISGNLIGTQVFPQLTAVATLRTAIPRGRGSTGRMYIPPSNAVAAAGADGRMSVGAAAAHAAGVKALIDSLNTEYTLIGRVGVASNAGSGRFEHVTRVEVGRVGDTMRSRRSSLVEDYQGIDI